MSSKSNTNTNSKSNITKILFRETFDKDALIQVNFSIDKHKEDDKYKDNLLSLVKSSIDLHPNKYVKLFITNSERGKIFHIKKISFSNMKNIIEKMCNNTYEF